MTNEFRLADSVLMRIIQAFQEAIMTGIDGADLLRQIRLQCDANDSSMLVMTEQYMKCVADYHVSLQAKAVQLKAVEAPGGND